MAAFAGRDLRIKYGSGVGAVVVAGARTDSMTINQTPIDITDKDDSGIRTMLAEYGTWSVDLTVSGVLVGTQLSNLVQSNDSTVLHAFEIEWGASAALGTWSGTFFITSFEVSGEEGDNPATFTASLQSSGNVTFA